MKRVLLTPAVMVAARPLTKPTTVLKWLSCLFGALLGTLAVGHAGATSTVTNTNDSGAGSLREAIAQANQAPGPDTINFAPGLTGTIILTSGQLPISGPLTIVGPGAGVLTIDGNASSRIFSIFENAPDICATPGVDFLVSISGLTLNNGLRNVAGSPGGAVYSEKTLSLNSVVISNSQAFSGGGLNFNIRYSGQSLTIADSSFLGNIARPLSTTTGGSNGGGLRVGVRCSGTPSPVTITINNSLFSANQTQPGATFLSSAGGGMHIDAAGVYLTMTNTRVVGNSVVNQDPPVAGANNRGGGISVVNAKILDINESEISGNSANRAGGMRVIGDLSTRQTSDGVFEVQIGNSTISGNVAVTPISGAGGIGVYGNVALLLFNSTVADNASAVDAAGGVVLSTGTTNPLSAGNALPPTIELVSSIVANSLNGAPDIGIDDELALPTISVNASQSLIGSVEPSVSVVGSGNLLGVNPNLGPLDFNGGNTRTQALLAGSPAINAGSNPVNLTTDQRGAGFPRVVGGVTDMGAFQSGSGSPYSRNYVQKAYVAYYGRPADPGGLGYWAGRMDAGGGSLNAIIGAFGYSDEFNRRYGGLGYRDLVTLVYQQALGRDPDQGGLDWYVAELEAGRRTLQTITLDVLNGATTAPDSMVVANKLDVAAHYTAKVAAGCAYGTEMDGVNAIAGVTANPASVTGAKVGIDTRCGP